MGQRIRMRVGMLVAAAATITLALVSTSVQAQTPAATRLTGVGVYVTDAAGSWGGLHYYNTAPDLNFWNLAIAEGGTAGPFINGPSNAQVPIDLSLTPGTRTFGLFGTTPLPGSGYDTGWAGINLHFNDSDLPSVSVMAPTDRAAGGAPVATPNANRVPTHADGGFTTGANTASFSDGNFTVEVLDFQFNTNPATPLDRISGTTTTPDGGNDLYGLVTIRVTPIPEPAAAAIAAAVPLLLLARRRTPRSSHRTTS